MAAITQIHRQIYIQAAGGEQLLSFDSVTLKKTMNDKFSFSLKRLIVEAVMSLGGLIMCAGIFALMAGVFQLAIGLSGFLWPIVAGSGAVILAFVAIHLLEKVVRTPLYEAYFDLFYRGSKTLYFDPRGFTPIYEVSPEAWEYFKNSSTDEQKKAREKAVKETLPLIPQLTSIISEYDMVPE